MGFGGAVVLPTDTVGVAPCCTLTFTTSPGTAGTVPFTVTCWPATFSTVSPAVAFTTVAGMVRPVGNWERSPATRRINCTAPAGSGAVGRVVVGRRRDGSIPPSLAHFTIRC